MKEEEYKVSEYSFSDARDYKEAKREAETVEYIKANTDLNDLNKVLKLYNKLVERRTLKTVIGFDFLKELRDKIINNGVISKENLPCIRVEREEKQIKAYATPLDHELEEKHKIIQEDYRIRIRNSRIIIFFLTGIIVVMLLISVFSDRSIFSNYENKMINKYSAWEEELQSREKAIEEKEAALNED